MVKGSKVLAMTVWVWENLGIISLLESLTESGVIILDVRDLDDNGGNVSLLKQKIILGANLLCVGSKVAVRCVAGMNRSNIVVLGIMCIMVPKSSLEETINHHYKVLKSINRRSLIHAEMFDDLKQALKELYWHNKKITEMFI
jgi:hypothetical protein